MKTFSPIYLHERDANVRRARRDLAIFALWIGLVAAGIVAMVVSHLK